LDELKTLEFSNPPAMPPVDSPVALPVLYTLPEKLQVSIVVSDVARPATPPIKLTPAVDM